MSTMLDLIRMTMRGEAPPPPIAGLIGFSLASVEPGHAVVELEAGERHANPMGTLHGGILCDIADAAMGMAYAASLEEGETFTTIRAQDQLSSSRVAGRLTASARLVQGGRAVGLVECDVTDDRDRLIARASSTCMTLRGQAAAGR